MWESIRHFASYHPWITGELLIVGSGVIYVFVHWCYEGYWLNRLERSINEEREAERVQDLALDEPLAEDSE